MDILLLLIPLAVVLALLIGAAFWWSVRSGQFDDLEGPAHRILADDDTSDAIPDAGARARADDREAPPAL
jgi:cbb3-type cytochrome oxidase maturation protein